MESKTPKTNSSGLTLIELALGVFILIALLGFVLAVVNPAELLRRGRDEKRLSDISKLERTIAEYKVDTDSYPDVSDQFRTSLVLPLGNGGPLESAADGWIDANLSIYASVIPIDPINDVDYYYSFQHDGFSYEINARFEFMTDLAQNDGGNDAAVYEVGDNLSII